MRIRARNPLVRKVLETLAVITLGLAATPLATAQQMQIANQNGMYRSGTFGAGWTADYLANLEIGRFTGRTVDYRFRSDHTGTFSALQLYFIFRTNCDGCYSDGDGGIIQIQVFADDNSPFHLPGPTLLGSTIVNNPFQQWNRTVSFSPPVPLKSNSLYHIVFTNLSSDPVHNYVSINNLYTTISGSNLQPAASESDLALLYKNGNAPLQVAPQLVPIFSIYFDDGFRQGQGYLDVKHNGMQIQSGGQVAETFVIHDADHTVSQVGVRFDPLTNQGDVRLAVNNALGQPLVSGVLDLSLMTRYSYAWQIFTFSPILLSKGGSYTIVLSAENGAQFYVSPIQQGAMYGFLTENMFSSECVIPIGVNWTGCMGMTYLDLPFYFR